MSTPKKLKSLDELKIDVDILIIEAADLNTHEDKLNLIAHIHESLKVLKNGMKFVVDAGDTDTADEDEYESKRKRPSLSSKDEELNNDCIEEQMIPMPVLKRQRLSSEEDRLQMSKSIEKDFLNLDGKDKDLDTPEVQQSPVRAVMSTIAGKQTVVGQLIVLGPDHDADTAIVKQVAEMSKSTSDPINGKGLDLFKCEHCDFMTEKENNLRTHMSRHNSSIKCDVCDVYFARSCNLKRHKEGVTHKARVALLNQANGNLVISLSSSETLSPQSSPIIMPKPKLCPIVGCNFSYFTEEQFEDHLLQCKYCTAYFHDEEIKTFAIYGVRSRF